jgi:hypothetical protein
MKVVVHYEPIIIPTNIMVSVLEADEAIPL